MLDFLCPVHLAAMLSDGDSSPALERSREHEAAAGAVPDVFMVNFLSMVIRRQVDRLAGIVAEFYRLLIHADKRISRITWSGIHFQDILHVGHERGVLLWRNAPHLFQVRLIPVFFSMRPICTYEMEGRISNCTARSDMSLSVHLPLPSGGVLHAIATIFVSTSPVHLGGTGGVSRFFRLIPAGVPDADPPRWLGGFSAFAAPPEKRRFYVFEHIPFRVIC